MTVENWGLEMEPTFQPDEHDELFDGNIWKDLPTPPRSPDEPVLDFGMELPGDLPDLGYQVVADVLTTLPVLEHSSSDYQSKVQVKQECLDSYFSKSDPMCAGFVKPEHLYQAEPMYPSVKSEPLYSIKSEPLYSIKSESLYSVKSEPLYSPMKSESMDKTFGKTEAIDTGFVKTEPLEEPLDVIDSENFLDSITSYYEPPKSDRHFGFYSLPCDSDCEEDSVVNSVPKPNFHKEDVLNNDCMWNGLDDVKTVSRPMDDCKLSDAYIPHPLSAIHSPASTNPKMDSCVKVPNGSIENSTLSDHCYYNNGLPTPSESDMDDEERNKGNSSEDDSDDTVRMPNNQKEVLRFINMENSPPVDQSLTQHLSAALMELRKSGKPITTSTVLEVTVPGKRKYRLRMAARPKGKIASLKENLIADNKIFSNPVNFASPLRNTDTRVTTVPVGRPRRTNNRKRQATESPVKSTPKRRRQNTASSRKRRRTSSGSESEDSSGGGKRVFHNNMERQRRIHLRQSFDNLKYLVPSLRDRSKTPKVMTLRESASYCSHLGNQESKLVMEKAALRAKQKELKIRLKLLEEQQSYY